MIDRDILEGYINQYGFNIENTILDNDDKKLLHIFDYFELRFWKCFLSNNIDVDTMITINDIFLYELFDMKDCGVQGYYDEENGQHYMELRKLIYDSDVTKGFNDKDIEYYQGCIFVYCPLKYNQPLYDSYIKLLEFKQKILNIYRLLEK